MIDTHCHLNSDQLYSKIDQVIEDAKKAGVNIFIVPGYDLPTSKLAIEIAHKYDNIYASIGFHPTEIKDYKDSEYQWLDEHADDEKVVAIGEVGYDFHWDTTTKEMQEESFKKQIAIAIKHHLPLIIHSRDANNLTYLTLKETNASLVGGVMHSYSGSFEMAKEFIKLNFMVGLGGPVTFLNAKDPKIVAKNIDLDYLLSETDSPYLTPHPYRGTENNPKYIPLIIKEIAGLKEISEAELVKKINSNCERLFKIKVDNYEK